MYHKQNEDGSVTYPYPLGRLTRDFPQTSFEQPFERNDLTVFRIFPVVATQPPDHDPISQRLDELPPVEADGQWAQQWEVVNLPGDQAEARLAAAKVAKGAEINASRLMANRGSFTHAGKSFACDELSRSDIDGVSSYVSLTGNLPPGWPGAWKAVDNTYLLIGSVAEWVEFVGAMVAAGNSNFAKSQALKAQLAQAETSAQINAIVW